MRPLSPAVLARSVPIPDGSALVYASNGDTNGLMYFLGTVGLTTSWANPVISRGVAITAYTLQNGTVDWYVNRSADNLFTTDVPNSFFAIDLGAGRELVPSKYTLQKRNLGPSNDARSWKFQGTNTVASMSVANLQAATWVDLDVQTNNTTLDADSSWVAINVSGVSTAYRYFRFIQTGLNSNSGNYFTISEVELYGLFRGTP